MRYAGLLTGTGLLAVTATITTTPSPPHHAERVGAHAELPFRALSQSGPLLTTTAALGIVTLLAATNARVAHLALAIGYWTATAILVCCAVILDRTAESIRQTLDAPAPGTKLAAHAHFTHHTADRLGTVRNFV